MCRLTLQNIFERTKVSKGFYFCGALKNILLAALVNQFSPLVYRRDYFFDVENCFPAVRHNHAVQYNPRRSPAACSLQETKGVRK
jgi:hypothetical protein